MDLLSIGRASSHKPLAQLAGKSLIAPLGEHSWIRSAKVNEAAGLGPRSTGRGAESGDCLEALH